MGKNTSMDDYHEGWGRGGDIGEYLEKIITSGEKPQRLEHDALIRFLKTPDNLTLTQDFSNWADNIEPQIGYESAKFKIGEERPYLDSSQDCGYSFGKVLLVDNQKNALIRDKSNNKTFILSLEDAVKAHRLIGFHNLAIRFINFFIH